MFKNVSVSLACSALAGLTTIFMMCEPVSAQRSATDDPRVIHAGKSFEGVSALPKALRDSLARDPALMQIFADLLEGRRSTRFAWDSAKAVWWLSESGDPKFVPLLLRLAREDTNLEISLNAAYGLARHAHLPAARERLAQLGRSPDPMRRYYLAVILAHVNDGPSRAVLRDIPIPRSEHGTLALRGRVLGGRGHAHGKQGKWPCAETESFSEGGGVSQCVSRAPRR